MERKSVGGKKLTSIRFGTDGWRAIIAEDYTFDNVRIVAQSVADYLKKMGTEKGGIIIGYDTRFGSEHFAAATAEVLAGNGITVYLCENACPTPTLSYGVLAFKTSGGVMITASHNPGEWNGFKYKPEYAGSASPEVVAELENLIVQIQKDGKVNTMPKEKAIEKGLIKMVDPKPSYFEKVFNFVDIGSIRDAGFKIIADPMYGAGIGYFNEILSGGKTQILNIHNYRNPIFPGLRPEPIAVNLKELSKAIIDNNADLGLATDGDADRIGIVDENGLFVTQLQVFALLALYLLEIRGWRGAIVKSLSTTSMIDKLGKLFNVPVIQTPVGFKYIGPKMLEGDAIIGGEESGGFGFKGHIPERDGIMAGLMIADMMIKLNRKPSQLVEYLYSKVGPHHYDRVDIEFPAEERSAIINRLNNNKPSEIENVKVSEILTVDGYKYLLEDGSWVLIRFSGTEPIMRVYCETDSKERIQGFLAAGRRLANV